MKEKIMNANQQNVQNEYECTQMNMFENYGEQQLDTNDLEEKNEDKSESKIDDNSNDIETVENKFDLSEIKTKAEAEKLLQISGLNYADLQNEYNETGNISKESRDKLLQYGISGEFIDEYIKGQEAVLDVELNEISECIGGRKSLSAVLDWAGNNLPEEEKISINSVHDKNLLKIILKDLKLRMEENEGIMPQYVKGDGAKVFQNVFRSKAEMFEAIKNPKYKKDEAYRSDVQRKIAASMRAGIDLGI